ncbi:MAG: hypothetical protein K9H84_02515 [Bacteroidales bacterium]|nr:hypothetical protein [Bacteroidales bacterium]
MKKILLVLILLPCIALGQQDSSINLTGKWVGVDETKAYGFFQFLDDGYAIIGIGDEVIGGKSFSIEGKDGSLTYKVNMDVEPIEILLTIHNKTDKTRGACLELLSLPILIPCGLELAVVKTNPQNLPKRIPYF